MKTVIRKMLGPTFLGMLDYYRFPGRRNAWGGAFNGQHFRKHMFEELMKALRPAFVIETGTHRGTTTEYLAQRFSLPIHSIESDKRVYGFARSRLKRLRNVRLYQGDSRVVLSEVFSHIKMAQGKGFYYLDAHWDDALPLREELDIIFLRSPDSVVLIDDFKIPDDPDYGFDDYGDGGACTLDFIETEIAKHKLDIFLPRCCGRNETGSKRGCVVLSNNSNTHTLNSLGCIRSWP